MKQCYGCFNQIDDNCNVCPYCGYIQNSPVPNNFCLTPGTLLSGRYIIGKSICSDRRSITYSSWDNYSESRVTIKEYFPSKHVTRDPQTLNIEPLNVESQIEFEKGFQEFVDEAKNLFNVDNEIKLLDCIAENNTAYMIMAYPEDPAVETISATEAETSKTSSLSSFSSRLKHIPLIIKIIVPALLIIAIVLIIIFSANGKKKTPDITEVSETTTVVSESTTESSVKPSVEAVIDVEPINFGDHSFAVLSGSDSWEAAEEYCESIGGHLVVINSVLENNAVWEYAKDLDYDHIYIGLSDTETEGTWKWVTGDDLTFSNWSEGQPDTNTQEENYAAFNMTTNDGTWEDISYIPSGDGILTGFVCEWEYEINASGTNVTPTENTSVETTPLESVTETTQTTDLSIVYSAYCEILSEYETDMRIAENDNWIPLNPCALDDINGDGIPELMIFYDSDEERAEEYGWDFNPESNMYIYADMRIFTVIPGDTTASEILHIKNISGEGGAGFCSSVFLLSNGNILHKLSDGDEEYVTTYTEYAMVGYSFEEINKCEIQTLIIDHDNWITEDSYWINGYQIDESDFQEQVDSYCDMLSSIYLLPPWYYNYSDEWTNVIEVISDCRLTFDEAWELFSPYEEETYTDQEDYEDTSYDEDSYEYIDTSYYVDALSGWWQRVGGLPYSAYYYYMFTENEMICYFMEDDGTLTWYSSREISYETNDDGYIIVNIVDSSNGSYYLLSDYDVLENHWENNGYSGTDSLGRNTDFN